MLFQTLDDKDQCIAIYLNGEITDELAEACMRSTCPERLVNGTDSMVSSLGTATK